MGEKEADLGRTLYDNFLCVIQYLLGNSAAGYYYPGTEFDPDSSKALVRQSIVSAFFSFLAQMLL